MLAVTGNAPVPIPTPYLALYHGVNPIRGLLYRTSTQKGGGRGSNGISFVNREGGGVNKSLKSVDVLYGSP